MGVKRLKQYLVGSECRVKSGFFKEINLDNLDNLFEDNNFIISIDFTNFFWSVVLIKSIQDVILQPNMIVDSFFINSITYKMLQMVILIVRESLKHSSHKKIHEIHLYRDGNRPYAKGLEQSLRNPNQCIVNFTKHHQDFILQGVVEGLFRVLGDSCKNRVFHNIGKKNALEADLDLCYGELSRIPRDKRLIFAHSKDTDIIPVSIISGIVMKAFIWPIRFANDALSIFEFNNSGIILGYGRFMKSEHVMALVSLLGTDYTPTTYYGKKNFKELLSSHQYRYMENLVEFKNSSYLYLDSVRLLQNYGIVKKSNNIFNYWKTKNLEKDFDKLIVQRELDFISNLSEAIFLSVTSLCHFCTDFYNLLKYWKREEDYNRKTHKRVSTNSKPVIIQLYLMNYIYKIMLESIDCGFIDENSIEDQYVIVVGYIVQQILYKHDYKKMSMYNIITMLSSYCENVSIDDIIHFMKCMNLQIFIQ